LRGKGRDQHQYDWHVPDHWRIPFPSPCGEKVGINVLTYLGKPDPQGLFPSPCGEKVGINRKTGGGYILLGPAVSVPLRGKGRDQPALRLVTPLLTILSFRPLAGKR